MRRLSVVVVAVAGLGLSACGDKGKPAKPTGEAAAAGETLSAAEFKAAKDSITPENAEAEADKLLAEIEADVE